MFKLLILDVDGVLCRRKTYDKDHNVLSKEFCDTDFTAIKRFIANGVPVVLLSGDAWNEKMALKRGLTFYFAERKDRKIDKLPALWEICNKYNILPKDTAYCGDDYFDIDILLAVGYKFCPLNAIKEVKEISCILPVHGGNGVVAELASRYNLPEYPLELENPEMWEAK